MNKREAWDKRDVGDCPEKTNTEKLSSRILENGETEAGLGVHNDSDADDYGNPKLRTFLH